MEIAEIDKKIEELDKQLSSIQTRRQLLIEERHNLELEDQKTLIGKYYLSDINKTQILKILNVTDTGYDVAMIELYQGLNRLFSIRVTNLSSNFQLRHYQEISESDALEIIGRYIEKAKEIITDCYGKIQSI